MTGWHLVWETHALYYEQLWARVGAWLFIDAGQHTGWYEIDSGEVVFCTQVDRDALVHKANAALLLHYEKKETERLRV